jgi:hypothetical protein
MREDRHKRDCPAGGSAGQRVKKAVDDGLKPVISATAPQPQSNSNTSERLEQLLAEDERLGRGSASDREFFACNPDRTYRLRPATRYEIAVLEDLVEAPPDGSTQWTAVRKLSEGTRVTLPVVASPLPDQHVEIPEAIARQLFSRGSSVYVMP